MFSLASLRYRRAFSTDGGPIERVESAEFPVLGQRLFQANAFLIPGLVPLRRLAMYGACNGTGAHRSSMVACHMAVSEALERWAFHATVNSNRRCDFGFDVDESSNGMAAFPGLSNCAARSAATFEAYERYCLLNWWEHRLDGVVQETEWPGISALTFTPARGVYAVVLFGRSEMGFYVYGHAAAGSFKYACKRAVLELARNELVVRFRYSTASQHTQPLISDRLERRAWFFSSPEGYDVFCARVAQPTSRDRPNPEVICDLEIDGPWSNYATVWRVAFKPPSNRFLTDDERYFFW
jgi:ribosomal protein S12 methylthiotransferase accessory factor YcaO